MFSNLYYIDTNKIGRDFTGKKDIAVLFNDNAIAESINNILGTQPGNRAMNPLFGVDLEQFLFSPIDPITTVQIKKTIEDGLNEFEPRIENLKVNVVGDEDSNKYDITVIFNTKLSKNPQNVGFTFDITRVR